MKELYFILVFFVASLLLAVAMIVAGYLCQYKKSSYEKKLPYECGVNLFSDARARYEARYFNYALLFLIFDIETLFLFPIAKNFANLSIFMFVEGLIFLFMLILALVYVIKKNVLRVR